MPRGGYRGGKPPTKSFTGERAKMVSFRLTPEAMIQLESMADAHGCTRTALIERLIATSPTAPAAFSQQEELDALRSAFAASQQGRQRLVAELTAVTERELAYQEEIHELRARLEAFEQGGPTWAHGVLHLEGEPAPEAVNRAFRELSKRFHPDLNPGDPGAVRYFRALVRARDVLLARSPGQSDPMASSDPGDDSPDPGNDSPDRGDHSPE